MNKFYTVLVVLFISSFGFGQTLLNETLRNGSLPALWTQTDVSFETSAGGYANFTSLSAALTTATFDSSANSSVVISFSVAKFGGGGNGPITVAYSLDGGSTWTTQGDSPIPTNPSYEASTIAIPATSATMQIRFTRGNSPSQKRLRDVLIEGIGTAAGLNYCNAGPSSSSDSEIETVSLIGETTAIHNDTSDSCTGQTGGFINDFTAQSADLLQGGSYSLSVEFGDCDAGTSYDGAGGVWIDWNNDFDFDDADETIGTADVAVGSGNVIETFNITVPANQALGSYRMRVVQEENGDAATVSPCGSFTWGSVEDYTIEVVAETLPLNIITFDEASKWTEGSGDFMSYQNDHVYTDLNWSFTGGGALRDSATASEDGFPNALDTFGWRLRNNPNTVWTASYNAALLPDEKMISFGFDARRWDDSPSPNFLIEYSFNGGASWNIAEQIGEAGTLNNAAFNASSNWRTYLQAIDSPLALNANQLVVRISAQGGTERIMIDNFSFLKEAIISPITYTFNGTWLPSDPNGAASVNDAIVIASGNATISQNTHINSVRVNPGASITIDAASSLTVVEALHLESSSTQYSSLIQNGSIVGSISYERFVNGMGTAAGGGNDLITPPLNGQRFEDFATANEGILAASGTLRAFAPFVNNANPGVYSNFDVVTDAETILEAGIGYRAAAGDVLQFTGTATTTDKAVAISTAAGHLGEWNLIGNPYPSYLDIEAFLRQEVSPGLQNIELLDNASGIYGYNGNATNPWNIISLSNAAGQLMAPGQGFFVASGTAGGALQFTTAMRRSAGGDDFISGRNAALVYLKLQAATSTKRHTTDFYFNEQSSLGLDRGYDAKTWGGQSSDVMLYSHLVEDNTGLPIGLQSLHSGDLANTSIPLGVHAHMGEQLTFSIAESRLPSTVDVYLEDTATQTFTLLNLGDYTIRPSAALNGTGRFFLRFSDSALSLKEAPAETLNISTNASAKTIVIRGQLLDASRAALYDLQGRLVHSAPLDASKSSQNIDVRHCKTGVYVLKVAYGTQLVYKKLLLR